MDSGIECPFSKFANVSKLSVVGCHPEGPWPVKEGWGSWGCSTWRKVQVELIAALLHIKGTYREDGEGLFFRHCSNRARARGFMWKERRFKSDIRKNSLLRLWWGTGTGCSEKLWMPQPWRCSRPDWMVPQKKSHLRTESSSLRSLLTQTILSYYYSMFLWNLLSIPDTIRCWLK